MRPCALHVRPSSRLPHCRRLPGFPLAISVSSVCRPLSIHAATLAHGHGSEAAWQDVCCIWMLFGCGLENQYFFYYIFFARGLQHTHCFSEVSEKQSCEIFWLYFVKFGQVLLGKWWTFPPKILHRFWSSLFLLGRGTAEQTCLPPVERQLIYIPTH